MLSQTSQIYKKYEFWILLGIALFLRMAFLISLGACTALAPDEGDYKVIFDRLFSKEMWSQQLPTNGNPLIYFLWLLPAKLFTLFGLPSLLALRINSLLFFTLSIILMYRLLQDKIPKYLLSKILILSTFIPSFFIYTSLGLREAFLVFLISFVFYEIHLFNTNKKIINLVFYFLGISLLSQVKWYLGIILFVSTFWLLFLEGKKMFVNHFKMISFCLVLITLSFSNGMIQTFKSIDITSVVDTSIKNKSKNLEENLRDNPEKRSQITLNLESSTLVRLHECKKLGTLGFLSSFEIVKNEIAATDLSNNMEAFPATNFVNFENGRSLRSYSEFPSALLNFLFLPLFNDHGGFISKLFIEGFIWGIPIVIVFIAASLFMIKRRKFHLIATCACIFVVFYAIFCAFTEVNLGTAMRHRLLLLFPIFLALSGASTFFFRSRGNRNQ
jgi:hypothetical protein